GDMSMKKENPLELEGFVNSMRRNAVVPTRFIDDERREYLGFCNGDGMYLNVEQMKFIVSELSRTVELDGLDEFIEEENREAYIASFYERDPDNEGKYLLPLERLNIKRKQFKLFGRPWSFSCGTCFQKVSSKDWREYFTINSRGWTQDSSERACSERCTRIIAKERVMEWIDSKEFHKYFNLEELDGMLTEIISNA
ncbi:hypothetical protein, partial [Metabacillus fastidiosus]|uniref:hypothetical protein n=1 Tax=Metabacillus fastidiosus TaxID=1458 RepID=UPI003D289485